MLGLIGTILSGPVMKILERIIPDPAARQQAQIELLKLHQAGEFKDLELSMQAIIAEGSSSDPWTSRARPTFLYLMYAIIIFCFIGGTLTAFGFETQVHLVANGIGNMLAAIPESLWWLFGAGYLGYTGGRTFEKWKKVSK